MTTSDQDRTKKPRVRLPDDVMQRLVERGLGNSQILHILLQDHGVKTVTSSITRWKERHGYPVRKSTEERLSLIPWRVSPAHSSNILYRRLRTAARARANRPLDRPSKLSLAAFEQDMSMLADKVIHYDRVNGWSLVPRRPGIDEDYIRDPRRADDGSAIEDSSLWQ